MKSNWLTFATFAGVIVGKFSPKSQFNLILPILGIALGIGLRESREKPWSKRESQLYVGFLGQLFLNMLKCVIIPLVIPSLITTADTLMDLLRNSFPLNIVQATTQQYKTLIIYPGEEIVSTLSRNLG